MGLQKYRADTAGEKCANGAIPWCANWMGGPTLALVRDCPVRGRPDIAPRTVYVTGEAFTYSSLPAACKYRTKTVRGVLICESLGYTFTAYPGQLPEQPTERTVP